ncbi:unnamed protein product, partial [Brassica oleracea]
MDEEKPPPQSLSQPRYTCKNCRRLLTHGGTLRNISTGGSGRKTNCPRIDQPSVPQVVPVETQQVNHHQPFFVIKKKPTIFLDLLVVLLLLLLLLLLGTLLDPMICYRVNQEDPNKPKQSFNNTMGMN